MSWLREAVRCIASYYRLTPAHAAAFLGSGLGAFGLLLWSKVRYPRHLKEK